MTGTTAPVHEPATNFQANLGVTGYYGVPSESANITSGPLPSIDS
jgi:hypothetical protein